MPKIALAANLAARDADVDQDGLLTNCFVEAPEGGDEGPPRVIKRPGFSLSASLGAGCAQGSITFNGGALFVQNDKIWTNFQAFAAGASWTATTAAPKPTAGSSVGTARGGMLASLAGSLYSIGGRDNLDTAISVYKSTDNGASWATISTPWTASVMGQGQMATVFNGRIFAMPFGAPASTNKEVWSSADGISWVQNSANLSGAGTHGGVQLITHNGLLYAFLGSTAAAVQVWSSPDGAIWTSVNGGVAGIGNRTGFVIYSLNGNLYLASGLNGAGPLQNDVWRSTDNGVTWTQITAAAAFAIRHYAQAWVYNSKLWIAGGYAAINSTPSNDVYSSIDGITWTLVTAAAGWAARAAAGTAVHNGTMYIGSGISTAVAVASTNFAAPGTATPNALTTPTQTCLPMQIALIPANGATPAKAFIKSTKDAWVFDGTTVTKVSDTDYPATTVSGVAYLDGAIYVMDAKGVVYGSDILAPLSWNALNFISANTEADAGVALARQLQYIVAFKEYSTEVFYDAANATGSPLGKVQSALLEVGMASSTSAAYSENTVYFVANSREKGRSVLMMEGYTPKSVSIPAVERILNADDLVTVWAFCVKISGHFFYVLTLKTSAITIAYDAKNGLWGRWTKLSQNSALTVTSLALQSDGSILATMPFAHGQSDGDVVKILGAVQTEYNGTFNLTYDPSIHSVLQFSYLPLTQPSVTPATGSITATFYQSSYFPGVCYSKGINSDLLLDEATGGVYSFDPTIFQDNSQPIDMRIRTNDNDFGVPQFKRFKVVSLECDKIVGNVLLRYTGDDYTTYSIYRPMDANSTYPRLNRLGRNRRRAWELRFTGATAFRARYLHAEIN